MSAKEAMIRLVGVVAAGMGVGFLKSEQPLDVGGGENIRRIGRKHPGVRSWGDIGITLGPCWCHVDTAAPWVILELRDCLGIMGQFWRQKRKGGGGREE